MERDGVGGALGRVVPDGLVETTCVPCSRSGERPTPDIMPGPFATDTMLHQDAFVRSRPPPPLSPSIHCSLTVGFQSAWSAQQTAALMSRRAGGCMQGPFADTDEEDTITVLSPLSPPPPPPPALVVEGLVITSSLDEERPPGAHSSHELLASPHDDVPLGQVLGPLPEDDPDDADASEEGSSTDDAAASGDGIV